MPLEAEGIVGLAKKIKMGLAAAEANGNLNQWSYRSTFGPSTIKKQTNVLLREFLGIYR